MEPYFKPVILNLQFGKCRILTDICFHRQHLRVGQTLCANSNRCHQQHRNNSSTNCTLECKRNYSRTDFHDCLVSETFVFMYRHSMPDVNKPNTAPPVTLPNVNVSSNIVPKRSTSTINDKAMRPISNTISYKWERNPS